MKYNIPDAVLREISSYARIHGIQKVILFGSRARGNHTKRSDIDIAISGGDAASFYMEGSAGSFKNAWGERCGNGITQGNIAAWF